MDIWWIDEPRLLGSKNPSNADLEQLRGEGFTELVSLLREEEQEPNYDISRAEALGFERHNIPVRDFGPPTIKQLKNFVDLIDLLQNGEKAIVHCQGGTGRTGTFAAAYWVAKGLTVSRAIGRVRKNRPHAVETPQQEIALAEFATEWRSNDEGQARE